MSQAPRLLIDPAAFNACYLPHLQAIQRTQIFYGGAGSGKSVFLAARAVLDALTGRNTLIVRKVARTLRASCFAEAQKCIARFSLSDFFRINKTEMSITCVRNGAQLLFLGLDDVEKIKSITPLSGALTDIWVEEATETAYHDIKQLEKRLRGASAHTKRLTLSFNPVSRAHWIYRQYFSDFPEDKGLLKTDSLLILRTTYRDNRFLTADDRAGMENEHDPYFRQVYTLGEWGVVGGAVFTNWRVGEVPTDLPMTSLRCGLDFGYAQDPAAAVLASFDPKYKRLYILREFRQTGLTNDLLAQKLLTLAGKLPITCDSAEPKSIAELRRLGVYALAAKKGPDSVLHGLQWLNQQEIILSPACTHLREELLNYRYLPDHEGGYLPRPTGPDHLIDALRYAMEGDSTARAAQAVKR
ncbi:MAG: PBSX family phage terminase large subunit [Christensenellales bacterium]|jgi:phage terminase large subunit|nr:PBSX family phage terminase large subunit [Clostridiales bacterium]